jgi:hypothetical protein
VMQVNEGWKAMKRFVLLGKVWNMTVYCRMPCHLLQ